MGNTAQKQQAHYVEASLSEIEGFATTSSHSPRSRHRSISVNNNNNNNKAKRKRVLTQKMNVFKNIKDVDIPATFLDGHSITNEKKYKLLSNSDFYYQLLLSQIKQYDEKYPKLGLKVRLILIQSTMREAFSFAKDMTLFSKQISTPPQGEVLAGIQIGRFVLMWSYDSLVTVFKYKFEKEPLSFELGILNPTSYQGERRIRSVCDLIVDYNVNKTYHFMECNCHCFNTKVMQALGYQHSTIYKSLGQLGNFIMHYSCYTSKQFMDPISSEEVVFTCHKEIDQYCRRIVPGTNKEWHRVLRENHAYDYHLLHCFDSCFWHGKFSLENLKSHHSNNSNDLCTWESCNCPFGDPYEFTMGKYKKSMSFDFGSCYVVSYDRHFTIFSYLNYQTKYQADITIIAR